MPIGSRRGWSSTSLTMKNATEGTEEEPRPWGLPPITDTDATTGSEGRARKRGHGFLGLCVLVAAAAVLGTHLLLPDLLILSANALVLLWGCTVLTALSVQVVGGKEFPVPFTAPLFLIVTGVILCLTLGWTSTFVLMGIYLMVCLIEGVWLLLTLARK